MLREALIWKSLASTPTKAQLYEIFDRIDDGAALFAQANCLASGFGAPCNLDEALRRLRASARAGYAPAWRVLGVLIDEIEPGCAAAKGCLKIAADDGDGVARELLVGVSDASGTDGTTLLREIESRGGALLHSLPAQVEQISSRPQLFYARSLLGPGARRYLMALAKDHLRPATVRTRDDRRGQQHSGRVAEDVGFSPWRQDLVLNRLSRRIAEACGEPAANAENLTIVRYPIGGMFEAHFDAAEASYGEKGDGDDAFGPRTVSVIVYLNEAYEGGETAFMTPRLKIKGLAGDGLFFRNQRSDGTHDEDALHAGMPVKSGEKWIVVQWFRRKAIHRCETTSDVPRASSGQGRSFPVATGALSV